MLQIIRLLCFGLLLITSKTYGFEFSDLNTSNWTACAAEGGICRFDGTRVIRYGNENSWSYAVATERIECSNRMFIDPLRDRAKVCELGKHTSRRLDGPRISVKPIFYVFKDQWHSGLPSEEDLRLIRHYLEHARDHFKQLLGPDVEAFDIAEASIHRGQYDESSIKKIAEQSLHTPSDQSKEHIQGQTQDQTRNPAQKLAPDFEHAMLKEILELRGSNRYIEPSVFVFILVNPNMQLYRPHWGGGGRSFNGGVNGGGGIVVLEYRRLRYGFYSTLVHELGHAFGLTHVNCSGQSMSESESIMSYNPRHRSRGSGVAINPGSLTDTERAKLLLSPRIFPHSQDLKQLQDQADACVLPAMDDYLGPVPNVHGVGYDLFFNERIVSGFDAMFYTKAQAKRHCAAMRERYAKIKVDCRFAGEVLQPSEPIDFQPRFVGAG
ncbi:MAG: M66 family metalloprotease, partial [Burkholderiaceae bacterium]